MTSLGTGEAVEEVGFGEDGGAYFVGKSCEVVAGTTLRSTSDHMYPWQRSRSLSRMTDARETLYGALGRSGSTCASARVAKEETIK